MSGARLRCSVGLAVSTFAVAGAFSCGERNEHRRAESSSAAALYARAQGNAERGQLNDALASLRAAFEGGFDTPMRAAVDRPLSALTADPESRPKFRDLLRDHAREGAVSMAPPGEPGGILVVEGVLVDEPDGKPIHGARIELIHADVNGRYFNSGEPIVGNSIWNPRLFAYLLSSHDGTFSARTIRPGSYKDDEGDDVPAHIHFSILADGYRPYYGEFLLGDDPLVTSGDREGVSQRGSLVATIQSHDGVAVCSVTIPLQPMPSE